MARRPAVFCRALGPGALALSLAASARADTRQCQGPAPSASLDKALPAEPDVLAGPGFALVLGAEAMGAAACAPTDVAGAVLTQAVLDAEAALGVDAALAIVLSSAPLSCGNLYYVPLANDARGIGYSHHDAREVFDDTPEHRLEGLAFLNDWPYWQAHPDELPGAVLHEVGHRWGARVHARVEGQLSAALLGRGQEHWSYFFSSGGSPLEGNVWTEAASGYVSDTPVYASQFTSLDLYLMGMAPAAEVSESRLLLASPGAGADCSGRPPSASSPPQTCGSTSLEATSTLVSIEDIIAAEGPRSPAPAVEPRSLDILPVVLHTARETWSAAQCEALAQGLREALAGFAAATRGRLRLESALGEGMSCTELSRASATARAEADAVAAAPAAPTCSLRQGGSPAIAGWGGWALLALGALRRRLGRSRRRAR